MAQLTLFDDRPSQVARLAPRLHALAAQGISFGTSSWKYEGWLGSIYTPDRYTVRGKFSQRKFEAECLAEYAETFPVVCGDFSFYQFPGPDDWQRLIGGTPRSLHFGFKVPEEITVAVWPSHARYGPRAGQANASFLDARLFEREFARGLEPYRDRVATLIFEFGTIPKSILSSAGEFSVAKGGYVGTRCGWFSDRSACYLAAGRPVILQATGFEDHLPVGCGLFAVRDVDEAAAAVRAIRAEPARVRVVSAGRRG